MRIYAVMYHFYISVFVQYFSIVVIVVCMNILHSKIISMDMQCKINT